MTIRELLQEAIQKTGRDGDVLGSELLLAFVLDRNREYLLAHPQEVLTEGSLERYRALSGRMLAGEPVAYLFGKKEFFGLEFFVDRRVLIPRPETEHLVEYVLNFVKEKEIREPNILDLGTGSGCIAVSLARHLPSARVTASDVSMEALEVAKKNAVFHGVAGRTEFFHADLLEGIDGPFDVIALNLPYIGEKRFSFVSKSAVDYEPHLALFGGEDGLSLYRVFFEQLSLKKWRPSLLAGEFGFLQKDELHDLISGVFPSAEVRFEQDYAHIDRMFVVEFPAIGKKN